MAQHREQVRLDLNDNFSGRMTAARDAAVLMRNEWALRDATWEPHDWREW